MGLEVGCSAARLSSDEWHCETCQAAQIIQLTEDTPLTELNCLT